MASAEITKVVIAVEVDSAPYFVSLPHDRMLLLMQMAAGLSDSGSLPVVKAPAGYEFTTLKG